MDPSGQESQPYAHAACDPVKGLDPTGLDCAKAVGDLVAAGVALAASVVGTIFSTAATIPSAGASLALDFANVLGYSTAAYSTIFAIGSVLKTVDKEAGNWTYRRVATVFIAIVAPIFVALCVAGILLIENTSVALSIFGAAGAMLFIGVLWLLLRWRTMRGQP